MRQVSLEGRWGAKMTGAGRGWNEDEERVLSCLVDWTKVVVVFMVMRAQGEMLQKEWK